MGNKEELIEKICVARDQEVGIYGFVFHRGKRMLRAQSDWEPC